MAVRSPRPMTLDAQRDFSGGLNDSSSAIHAKKDEIRRAENARLDHFGAITKRKGTQRIHATALPASVLGIFSWITTTQQLIAVSNQRVYTGTFAIPMTWTVQGAPGDLSATVPPSFAAFRDGAGECVYIADGGLLNKWDGANVTINIAGTPSVTRLWVYNRRLFGTGNPASPQTVYWSALDNGDSLGNVGAGGGEAVVRTFGQSDLVTGETLKYSALMFHKGGISVFTGWSQDDIAIQAGTRGLSSTVGTLASRSPVVVEGMAFILSTNGFFAVTDSNGAQLISEPIEATVNRFDFSQAANVVSAHHREFQEVWWYLPGLGCYVYNYHLQAWTGPMGGLYLDKTITAMCQAVNATNNPTMLVATSEGFVYQADGILTDPAKDDVLSDGTGGTTYVMAATLRRFFNREYATRKAWRWIYMLANLRGNQDVALEMNTETGFASRGVVGNYGDVWDPTKLWNPALQWSGQDMVLYRVPAGFQGPYLDVTIVDAGESDSTYASVEIIGYSLGMR